MPFASVFKRKDAETQSSFLRTRNARMKRTFRLFCVFRVQNKSLRLSV